MASSVLNSDDGVISGTSGLKSSGGDDGVLVFQSKGTETARINTDKQIVAAAGTASLPALTTTGDVNTGIFFPAADTIAFAEGGAEAMRIDSDGDVGIGTTSPAFRLDVAGTTATNAAVGITRYSGPGYLYFQSSRGSSVGSNTIVQNGDTLGILRFNGANNTDFTPAAEIRGVVDGTPGASNDMPGRLVFLTTPDGSDTPNERARITNGGYFKQSDNATYTGVAQNYNEFNNSADTVVLWLNNTNASFADRILGIVANRSANSAYHFGEWYSGNFVDKEFGFRGDGNAFADGTWSNNGADYAEFFESVNGQALTLGAAVVLDGNKVREATEQDPASAVIGVVRPKEPSKASMVIGNTAWNKWANKYLTDDFDRYIMEDHDVVEWEETITDEDGNTSTKQHSYESHNIPEGITVPADATRKTHDDKGNKFQHYKLNPAWNPDSEYVNRENRPEWNIIGLLGQVKILKGQPVGDRWVKMRDVSDTVEEWFIR
jgi:hypothetical protein